LGAAFFRAVGLAAAFEAAARSVLRRLRRAFNFFCALRWRIFGERRLSCLPMAGDY
jgi:hypothetical protein